MQHKNGPPASPDAQAAQAAPASPVSPVSPAVPVSQAASAAPPASAAPAASAASIAPTPPAAPAPPGPPGPPGPPPAGQQLSSGGFPASGAFQQFRSAPNAPQHSMPPNSVAHGPHGSQYPPNGGSPGHPHRFHSGVPHGPGPIQYGPGPVQYGPGGVQYGHGGAQYGHGGVQYGPGGVQYGPGGAQYGPSAVQYGPSGGPGVPGAYYHGPGTTPGANPTFPPWNPVPGANHPALGQFMPPRSYTTHYSAPPAAGSQMGAGNQPSPSSSAPSQPPGSIAPVGPVLDAQYQKNVQVTLAGSTPTAPEAPVDLPKTRDRCTLTPEARLELVKLCVKHQEEYVYGHKTTFWKIISGRLQQEQGIKLRDPRSTVADLIATRKLELEKNAEGSGNVQLQIELARYVDLWINRESEIRRKRELAEAQRRREKEKEGKKRKRAQWELENDTDQTDSEDGSDAEEPEEPVPEQPRKKSRVTAPDTLSVGTEALVRAMKDVGDKIASALKTTSAGENEESKKAFKAVTREMLDMMMAEWAKARDEQRAEMQKMREEHDAEKEKMREEHKAETEKLRNENAAALATILARLDDLRN